MVDANPRSTWLPGESAALREYLAQGGAALLLFDLGFSLEPGLQQLLDTLGVELQQAVVADRLSHYGTDEEMVAVTAYDPHPVTQRVAYTFFPGARPLVLGQGPPDAGARVALLVAYAIGFFGLALVLTRRRLRA